MTKHLFALKADLDMLQVTVQNHGMMLSSLDTFISKVDDLRLEVLFLGRQLDRLNEKFDAFIGRFDKLQEEFNEFKLATTTRFLALEGRTASLEGRMDSLESKMDRIIKHFNIQ